MHEIFVSLRKGLKTSWERLHLSVIPYQIYWKTWLSREREHSEQSVSAGTQQSFGHWEFHVSSATTALGPNGGSHRDIGRDRCGQQWCHGEASWTGNTRSSFRCHVLSPYCHLPSFLPLTRKLMMHWSWNCPKSLMSSSFLFLELNEIKIHLRITSSIHLKILK